MSTAQAQTWKSSPFTVERIEGNTPGTVIFRFRGPCTARDMYSTLSPEDFNAIFDISPNADGGSALRILDLTDVPYMDSSGLAVIVRKYVRCKNKGIPLVVAGACPRILDLLRLTKVDGLIPTVAAVEEAETR